MRGLRSIGGTPIIPSALLLALALATPAARSPPAQRESGACPAHQPGLRLMSTTIQLREVAYPRPPTYTAKVLP